MVKFFLKFIILATLISSAWFGISNGAFAVTKDTQQLQDLLASIKTMQANFTQVVRQGQRIVQRSQGSLAISRPGRFRWSSTQPIHQLIVADGKSIWIYDQDLAQVTVKPMNKGMKGTPALFLSGYDLSISRYFYVKAEAGTQAGEVNFTLSPKSKTEGMFSYVWLHFIGKKLQYMQLIDHLGQTVETHFSQVRVNSQLSSGLFQFKMPQGVEVVQH